MLTTIPHSSIFPNPDQPRKTIDRKELEHLAASIRENGLLQPITVRPKEGGTYEIVAGERRWRAHGILIQQGFSPAQNVSCYVRDMTDSARDIMAIIENLQRVEVAPVEEARAFKRMVDLGLAVEDLAKKLGWTQKRVEDRMRLMDLDPGILRLCEAGFDHHVAQEIARLPGHRDQLTIFRLWNSGKIVGFNALKAAVAAKSENMSQTDLFGEAPTVSAADVEAVRAMERKIEQMLNLAAAGFKDGECTIAQKVSPDRTRLMADKIVAIKKALNVMERELRCAGAQATVVFEAAE